MYRSQPPFDCPLPKHLTLTTRHTWIHPLCNSRDNLELIRRTGMLQHGSQVAFPKLASPEIVFGCYLGCGCQCPQRLAQDLPQQLQHVTQLQHDRGLTAAPLAEGPYHHLALLPALHLQVL